jgi:chemotaxis signal transduction protein
MGQIEGGGEESNIVVLKVANDLLGIITDNVKEVIEVSEGMLEKDEDSIVLNIKNDIITLTHEGQFKKWLNYNQVVLQIWRRSK